MTMLDLSLPRTSISERFVAVTPEEMRQWTAGTVDWLWRGYVARRNVTLLTSQWKAGKTTLVAVLLARLAAGGELAGREVRPGRSVVVSEEDDGLWVARDEQLSFGGKATFLCRPFAGRPSAEDWNELVAYFEGLAARHELDLAVIDSLAGFVPGSENDAATMVAMMKPLQRLAERGAAVLVLHHPRKAAAAEGRAARGSGALSAAADITVEMGWLTGPSDDDRRRILRAFSRHKETPRRLAIEWTADGRDYLALGESALDDFDGGWPILEGVLEDAHQKLTRGGILDDWPEDHPKPSAATLWRWLERAMKAGRVQRDGRGRSHQPFRYWLTGQEERWKSDPLHFPDIPDLPPLEDAMDLIKCVDNIRRNSARIDAERRAGERKGRK